MNATPLDLVILFIAAFLAAGVSGSAGFGGALLLLPVLTALVGASLAVPLLTVAQLVGNLSRILFNWSKISWVPVLLFLTGAVPSTILGAYSFLSIPKQLLVRIIGGLVIVFATLSLRGFSRVSSHKSILIGGGFLVGFLSGLAGSAGPLGAIIFLTIGLPPLSYIATEATSAFVMHAIKLSIYQKNLRVDSGSVSIAAVLTIAVILGTWAGKSAIRHLSVDHFQHFVQILLLLMGLVMLLFG